jgi:outer membrane biosynthesis protein TonB
MFIKLTRTDGTPVWLNPEFIVRIEPWKKGSAVAVAGDGDFELMEDPRAILALAGGVRVAASLREGRAPARPSTGETPVVPVVPAPTGETPVVPVASAPTGETPVVPVRKTRSRKKAATEPAPEPAHAPEPAPEPAPAPAPEPAPAEQPADNLFPQAPDEVAVAAAILKKNRCRSRKRIQNTIKSMNPKMSMADARAMLEQMEARGLVLIDAQGHATFT